MNQLDVIIESTKETVKKSISFRSIASLEEDFEKYNKRGFEDAIMSRVSEKETAIIAEIKKASPSKGIIREDFEPIKISKEYEEGGATCLSILTDEPFFQGKLEYLDSVRSSCELPILRKDFMIDLYQIYETKAYGGDCILLIVAALDIIQLKDFSQLARELNLDILIEVHSEDELNEALSINSKLIGINNRDLTTFEVDKNLAIKLARQIPKDVIVVSESGISSREDILSSKEQGIHSFLIGESFMRKPNPGNALKDILEK
jgi:indole-3-glycerol phosphate synthase